VVADQFLQVLATQAESTGNEGRENCKTKPLLCVQTYTIRNAIQFLRACQEKISRICVYKASLYTKI